MKKHFAFVLLALLARPVLAASPTDIVPRASGLYDALAVLAQDHLLPANAPDVNDLLNVQGRLYTRIELARAISGVTTLSGSDRDKAALAFARNILAPELKASGGIGTVASSFGASGVVSVETGSRTDTGGGLKEHGDVYGRGRLFGSLGRDGAYTISATNFYTQFRDHDSFTTRAAGTAGGDNPGALNGIDEAYMTAFGHHGIRMTAGLLRQRWGSGYEGTMLVGDNAPARPTLQLEVPFYLGHTLGSYDFTQFESIYRNNGRTVYQGGRRLEHLFGDRVRFNAQEAYTSNEFHSASVLFIPYYAYQSNTYTQNIEPTKFNYLSSVGLTLQPDGPRGNSRLYTEIGVDDLKAPFGLSRHHANTPRKVGFLAGYAQTFPRSGTDAVLEYRRNDRAFYTDAQPELDWFKGDLPMASSVGPNGREVFGRLGQRVGRNLDIALELRDRRRVANDFPAPSQRSIDLLFGYRLGVSRSLGLRLTDYREDPFTGTSASVPGVFGGAANGERLRRHILALSFLQSF